MKDNNESIETYKARIAELEALVVQVKAAQRGSDKAYADAAKKVSELEKKIAQGASEAQMLARLDGIQAGYRKKERELELSYFKKSRCLDAGIPYELLQDVDLPDEPSIEKKIGQLSQAIEDRTIQGIGERLMSSEKPKSGGGTDRV